MADGSKVRPLLVFNGILPGPTLVVCEGDNVKVELQNRLRGQDPTLLGSQGFNMTTLHFHGIRQKQRNLLTSGNVSWSKPGPWSDGVPLVTQCPVPAGEDFHYFFSGSQGGGGVLASFNNAPAGSYWYHSHVGNQRLNGASGKLIVMPREPEDGIVDRPENSLFLQEWYKNMSVSNKPESLLVNGKGKLLNTTYLAKLRPGETEDQFLNSYKMGKPVFFEEVENPDYPSDPRAQYEVFNISETEKGKLVRFRLISGIGEEINMRVSIEEHSFTAIASDAIDINETETLDAVWLSPGERYDILVKTKADTSGHPNAYKINIFHSYAHNPNTTFELCSIAWLKYPNQTVDHTFEPDCKSLRDTRFENAVLNPVPNNITEWESKKFIFPKDLRARSQAQGITRVLNTHYIDMSCGEVNCNFNNYQMIFPTAQTAASVAASGYSDVPFLFQSPSIQSGRCGPVCNKTACTNQEPSQDQVNCTHIIQQPMAANDWFEIVLINKNPSGLVAHPIHQHGGWYNVIGQGQFDQNITITREIIMKMDKEGLLPRNLDHPVFKDVVQVPTNGYVIFRTPLDNAGTWIAHCHINYHIEHGMAMVFQFGETRDWAMGPTKTAAFKNKNKTCLKQFRSFGSKGRKPSAPSLVIGVMMTMVVIPVLYSD